MFQLSLNITRISGFESYPGDVFVEAEFRGDRRKEMVRKYTGKVLGDMHWVLSLENQLRFEDSLEITIKPQGQKNTAHFKLILQRVVADGQVLIDDNFSDSSGQIDSNLRLLAEVTYFNLENADLTEQWVKGVEFESVAPVTNTAYTAQKNSLAVPLIDANNSDFENAQLKGSSTGGSQYGDEKKKRKKKKGASKMFKKISTFAKRGKGAASVRSAASVKGANDLDEQLLLLFDETLVKPVRISSAINEDFDQLEADSQFKESGFQINVHVIEAQRLAGAELHPFVIVEVADQKKTTKVIEETVACPYFDESFVFDFVLSPMEMFTSIIKLTVLNKGGLFTKDENIGEFKIDVGTVYNQPGHCFFNRWAILFDPDDVANGTSGALKVTMGAIGKGDAIKPPPDPEDDDDVIEGNELIPEGFPLERQLAHYVVRVYRAIGLPRMSSGFVGHFKKALGDAKDMVDPYVELTFSGLNDKTAVQQNQYSPEWYEEIIFSEMFPPMCTKLKVELKDKHSLTSATIGTFSIDMNEISCEQEGQGFMPTFGPTWINMYGSLRSFSFSDEHGTLNRGVGEGVAFRGQVLVGLDVRLADPIKDIMTVAALEDHNTIQPLNVMYTGKKEEFFLYCVIMEASVIDKIYAGKPVYFELSIGNHGNNIDGQNTHYKADDKKKTKDDDKDKKSISSKDKDEDEADGEDDGEEENTSNPHSDSKSYQPKPVTGQQDYYFLDFGSDKPALFVRAVLRDYKERHYRHNILSKVVTDSLERLHNLSEHLTHAGETVPPGVPLALKVVMGKFRKACSEYVDQTMQQLNSNKIAGKTKLDSEQIRHSHREIEQILYELTRLEVPEDNDDPQVYMELIRSIRQNVNRLKKHLKEPQPGLPDVFLWMISGGRRVAYARIPSGQLIFSPLNENECGPNCGKISIIFLKLPGKMAKGETGWAIQAKLEAYMWLSHSRNRKEAFDKLPGAYQPENKVDDPFKTLKPNKTWNIPRSIKYSTETKYMLRAHMYQARSLLPADDTGLSDPFARVIIGSSCCETQILDETLNPTWDEMLMFEDISINYEATTLKTLNYLAIVEIFDSDSMGSYEFIGRTKVRPIVKEAWQNYEKPEWPPDLEWHTIHRGNEPAGELLAQFELLEIPHNQEEASDKMPPSVVKESRGTTGAVFPVPPEIRPVLCEYRFEVLFWGLRGLKRINLFKVEKPKVIIEVGNSSVVSETILDMDRKPNFNIPVKIIREIDLPEREIYMPPVTIRVMDCRKFGRETLVGTHSITSLAPLIQRTWVAPVPEDEMSIASGVTGFVLDPESQLGQVIIEMGDEQQNFSGNNDAPNVGIENPIYQSDEFFNDQKHLISRNPSIASMSLYDAMSPQNIPRLSTAPENSMTPKFLDIPCNGSIMKMDNNSNTLRSARETQHDIYDVLPGQRKSPEHTSEKLELVSRPGSRACSRASSRGRGGIDALEQMDTQVDARSIAGSRLDVQIANDEEMGSPEDEQEERQKTEEGEDDKKKEEKEHVEEEDQVLDWWTKYFASLQLFKEKQIDLPAMIKAADVVNPEAGEKQNEEGAVTDKDDSAVKPKKRKFPWRRKRKADTVTFENSDFDPYEGIMRFLVFDDELEKQPEFDGFVDLFESFKLRRGKKETEEEDEDARVVGIFKGKIKLYKLPLDPEVEESIDNRNGLFGYMPPMDPVPVIARIYVIGAVNLHPMDSNGKADPYLQVTLGNQSQNTKEEYVSKNLNPTFGKMFEFEFTIPLESTVTVSVYDYDMVGSNDLIGETVVDLENRFYSKHRASCGFSLCYDTFGYNLWRDAEKPTTILSKLCRDLKISEPLYKGSRVKVGGKVFRAPTTLTDEMGTVHQTHEHLALEVLKNWHTIPKHGFHLVPEHIETRPLFNPETPGIEQGRLQMWIDMFPKDTHIPGPIDISPRIPKGFELRVIVWNTDDVILEEENLFGERMSDIYVRGWLKGPNMDAQSTDIHYRSLTGEGNFNWRFVFPFEYLAAEEKIVFRQKESTFALDETEFKIPLRLQLQVWDADAFSADDILGSLTLDLNRFPRGAKSPKRCTLDLLKTDGTVRQMSIFRNRRVKGWWPFTRKNDDQEFELTGKCELEMILVSVEEAEKNPVGLGREAPEPMKPPNRPDSTIMWFIQPFKSLALMLWRNHKWLIIKLVILALLTAILALFIYSAPGYMVKKIMGA